MMMRREIIWMIQTALMIDYFVCLFFVFISFYDVFVLFWVMYSRIFLFSF